MCIRDSFSTCCVPPLSTVVAVAVPKTLCVPLRIVVALALAFPFTVCVPPSTVALIALPP